MWGRASPALRAALPHTELGSAGTPPAAMAHHNLKGRWGRNTGINVDRAHNRGSMYRPGVCSRMVAHTTLAITAADRAHTGDRIHNTRRRADTHACGLRHALAQDLQQLL